MTHAVVKNGTVMRITDDVVILGVDETNHRIDEPKADLMAAGIYGYVKVNAAPGLNQRTGSKSLIVEGVAGTVTELYAYVDMTSEEIKQATNGPIDAQIVSSERQALETGLVRTLVEDLMNRALDQAGLLLGMTLPLSGQQKESIEAMLLDEAGPYFSKPYAKIYANAAERAALRSQRV